MGFYLGIYSKKSTLIEEHLEQAVESFSFEKSRNVNLIQYDRFRFYYTVQKESYKISTEEHVTFVSGYVTGGKKSISYNSFVEELHQKLLNNPDDFLVNAEGAFIIVSYDVSNHQLILANDKFGAMSVFIYENEDYFFFSNEYEPLICLTSKKELNYNAIAEFFTLGSVLNTKTFLKEINKLIPAGFIVLNEKNSKQKNYWIPNIQSDSRSISVIAKEVYDLFHSVNNETVNSGITEVYLLSAGADSRLIVATLPAETLTKLKFYTSNLSFLSEEEDKDVVGAKLLAKKLNLDHRIEKIAYYENSFGANYFSNCREMRQSQVYGGWHGGEFLGGFCFNASPLKPGLTKDNVDSRMKCIFSRNFRKKITKNPFESYASLSENQLYFCIQQFTQPFFTTIYSGSRGHWLQPYHLTNHGYSPFWDSRILQKLLTIPTEYLFNYRFYNEVFKYADPKFLEIGSNSPLTKIVDSVLPVLEIGVEPKHHLPNMHGDIHKECMNNKKIWGRGLYKRRKLKKILEDENSEIAMKWLDFEVWLTYYINY